MKARVNWMPLLGTNFLGVFNDNFLKFMVVYTGIEWAAPQHQSMVLPVASALLVLPFILFSPLGGRLALQYDKNKIFSRMKLAEIPVMVLAIVAFYFQNLVVAMIAVVLMGFLSSLYSPSKYGLIRDIGGREGISYGTGAMEMFTFAGVLLGTFGAAILSQFYDFRIIAAIYLVVAVGGYLTSRLIKVHDSEPMDVSNKTINPAKYMVESIRWSRSIPGLNVVIVALSTFWLIGGLLQMNLIAHCDTALHMDKINRGIVMAAAAVGIGLGCYFAGVVSHRKVELRLVPVGGLGMAAVLLFVYLVQPTGWFFTSLIALAAFFTGLYKVPLNAWVQDRVEGRMLGDILAYCNLLDFTFILAAAGVFAGMTILFDTNTIFLALVLFMLAILGILYWFLPEMRRKK